MKEKRDEVIILRLTKTEKHCIYEKMLGMGIRSLSAYIRKMALDGYCLHLDLKELRRMAYLLQMCSNNLNQYAKCANESGQVYAADLEDLRTRFDELASRFFPGWLTSDLAPRLQLWGTYCLASLTVRRIFYILNTERRCQ